MMAIHQPPEVILASGSPVRANLLRNAGVIFRVAPVFLDEDSIKHSMSRENALGAHIAETLAELKTLRAARNTNAFVIGADQILSCDGKIFSKPASLEKAKEQLLDLRGRTHELFTTVCVAKGGSVIWRHSDAAELQMRSFSSGFLESYLAKNQDRIETSCGGYFLESDGVQLFDLIKGDYFTILGLPLIPLLNFLREQGVLQK